MPDRPPPESPLIHSPDGATPPSAWDETLLRAIDAGRLDASQVADAKLAGAFAAHQKLESLFAALRGEPDNQAEPAPSQLGRYVIGASEFPDAAILGAGAFGTVYLAHDPELNREVAIKVSSLARRARADAIATEARHAASLNHPGIVTIHDVGREGERLFIVMEYIRGQTLEQLLREGPVAPARAAELLAAVADALHYAHKRGFVHRDLKPANILLDEQGTPHVADFGLAVNEETQRALGGQVAGTPEYMAPEQIRGESHRLDGRTDVWALGVILYESLAGRRPFAGSSTRDVLDEIEHREPKPPRQINDAVPAELERICLKCLSKRMTDRYATAADVAADLRDFRSQPDLLALARGPARLQTASPAAPPAVIPKGLRSFDAHDADFFLQLLPGPWDRDGLPESLRFWKTRVEQTDVDATFAVGLIYGPSGCGKSSLVKAGLLPRLAPHVLPVYLEATADDTEGRLLKALLRRSPELTARELVGAIAELRAGNGFAAGRKLLIVLDQFEQWLHAHGDPRSTELVRAMRQCDGGHVQCLVMVRDDFWLSASRLMQALEIPLVEQENSALVDLFDPLHARRVLTLFGRAYGRLPAQADLSTEESQFIEQAVAELAEAGKVVSVRLALFAEMVKGKPWTVATLKEIGGIAGVGATFLEETFSAATAPPRHRLHQKAAQAALKALLPDAGTDLKGHRRSRDELLSISGYIHRPADFTELLRILDAELRLVTPADEEPAPDDPSSQNPKSSSQPSYQLTHDYLVPSLRDWLTRKQRETRRGRAELRLSARAAAYAAAPDSRHLPGWWEWPNILFFTRRRGWSEAERRVMRAAGRRRGLQAVLVAMLLVAGTFAGREARRRVNEDRDRVKADGIVQRLLEAPLAKMPAIMDDLQPYRRWADPKLWQVLAADSKSAAAQRLRASIALLDVDPMQADPIFEALLNSTHEDARVLINVLRPFSSDLAERLKQIIADDDASRLSTLRAAMALASYTSPGTEYDFWEMAAPLVIDLILEDASGDPGRSLSLGSLFLTAVKALLPHLADAVHDEKRNPIERYIAATLFSFYAADNAAALADLLIEVPEQFLTLFPMLEKHGDAAVALLARELGERAAPNWHDPHLDPSWRPPAESLVTRIEAAGGMVAERFALVQTLPLDDFQALAEDLRQSGYRPLRCRPYPVGDQLLTAGVWTRDAIDWEYACDLDADQAISRHAELWMRGYSPVDVAGYTANSGTRFTLIWCSDRDESDQRVLRVNLLRTDLEHMDVVPVTIQSYASQDGSPRYAITAWKGKSAPGYQWHPDAPLCTYTAGATTDRLEIDVSLLVATPPPAVIPDATASLDAAEKALAEKPNDLYARFQRGVARYYATDDVGAIKDLTLLAETWPEFAYAFEFRALAYARTMHADEARADVHDFAENGGSPSAAAYLDAVVSANLGEADGGTARLEAAISRHAGDAKFLYEGARAYSVVAGILRDDPERAAKFQKRAMDLLKRFIQQGPYNFEQIYSNPDFESLFGLSTFQQVLEPLHLEWRFAAIYGASAAFMSASPHGLAPEQHLERCRELAQLGYRPVAVSLSQGLEKKGAAGGPFSHSAATSEPASVTGGKVSVPGTLIAASVWHLPRIDEAEKELIAQRQANAAVALLRLGEAGRVWPLLRHSPDPRMRSWLVHRMLPLGVESKLLIERLFEPQDVPPVSFRAAPVAAFTLPAAPPSHTPAVHASEEERDLFMDDVLFDPEVSIRRALILSLGELEDRQLPAADRSTLLEKLVELYRSDPDAGIHSAAAWLVGLWGGAQKLAEVNGAARGERRVSDGRRWYVNSQGQTMVVVAGPVEFLMGSPADEPHRHSLESLHKCRIDRSFAIGAHEVTVDQIKRWRPEYNYGSQSAPTSNCPANQMSWYEAAEYCNWLSEQEGLEPCYKPNPQGRYEAEMRPAADYLSLDGYRLPTEAEWEFACRAGATTSRFYGSTDALLGNYACYEANSQRARMFEVGWLKPNDLGLFDLLGNAPEWCGDRVVGPYWHLSLNRPRDDAGDAEMVSDVVDERALRGGAFDYAAWNIRSAARDASGPTQRVARNGFRLARTLPEGSLSPLSRSPSRRFHPD